MQCLNDIMITQGGRLSENRLSASQSREAIETNSFWPSMYAANTSTAGRPSGMWQDPHPPQEGALQQNRSWMNARRSSLSEKSIFGAIIIFFLLCVVVQCRSRNPPPRNAHYHALTSTASYRSSWKKVRDRRPFLQLKSSDVNEAGRVASSMCSTSTAGDKGWTNRLAGRWAQLTNAAAARRTTDDLLIVFMCVADF